MLSRAKGGDIMTMLVVFDTTYGNMKIIADTFMRGAAEADS